MTFFEQDKSVRAGPDFIPSEKDGKKKLVKTNFPRQEVQCSLKIVKFKGFQVVIGLLACSGWLLGHWVF